jgi:NAD(P)-dependent dehydrogenase (short-subunit alcohol dehydrogenase family)
MSQPLAVIFGAGPGIGLAVARRFAQGGFRVAAVARPGDPLAAFQASIDQAAEPGAPSALVLGLDLALEGAAAQACQSIEQAAGLPQVLVWNASAGTPGPAAEIEAGPLLADLRVNLLGPLEAVRWALPAMRRAGRGTLLFTGGGLALAPKPGLACAALGKAALRNLALSLAEELAPEGIHAATVTVCGFVQPGPLAPDRIAQVFWELHLQQEGERERERVLAPPLPT